MLIYGAVRKPSCTADRHDSAQCTVRVASTCSHASHGVRQYQPSTCTHCMYRPYNRLLTCTAYYSTWYHAACAAHKDQQPRRTHVLDLVQNRLRARPRTYVAASSLCARPRSSNNSLCARPRSCKLFVRPTSMHRPACTQMVGSRSRLRASDRSSKLLARASKSFGQPTVHTRPIRTPQTAPTASNPIRSELCFKGGLASFDRLHKRFAAAAAWPFSGTPFVQPIKTLSAPSSGGILRFIALMWPLAPAACANVYSYSCCTLYAVRVPYIHARAGRLCPTTAVASYRAPYFEYRTSTSTS
jgi:hypothetical protein